MGKDGGGGDGGSGCSCSSRGVPAPQETTMYDMHIQTLNIIDAEMQRLHVLIQRGDDDVDTSQSQLGELQSELIRLSNMFAVKEVE